MRFAARTGQPCGADNVVVTPGRPGRALLRLQCLAGPGDEVIVPEPVYATYEGVVARERWRPMVDGAAARRARLSSRSRQHRASGDAAHADRLDQQPAQPHRGGVHRRRDRRHRRLCRGRDLWLLSDEVYEDLAFARPHVSPWSLPGMAERTVVVSSLSKSHAMPGFRLGWIIGPPALSRHLFALLLSMTYGSPPFIQEGALAALGGELPEVAALREDYRRRAGLMSGILADAPNCRAIPPEGGMFVLLDIRGTGLGSRDFAARPAGAGGCRGAAVRRVRAERRRASAHLADRARRAPRRSRASHRALRPHPPPPGARAGRRRAGLMAGRRCGAGRRFAHQQHHRHHGRRESPPSPRNSR